MAAERILALSVNFGWLVVIARELGPAGFGQFSYFLALYSLLLPLTSAGLQGLAVKEYLEKDPDSVFTNIALIRIAAASLALFMGMLALDADRSLEPWLLLGFGLFGAPLLAADAYLQSLLRSRLAAYARLLTTTAFLCVKALLYFEDALSVSVVCAAWGAEVFAYAVVLWVFCARRIRFRLARIELSYAVTLIRSGGWLLVASFCEAVNLRSDQLLLEYLGRGDELGAYAFAARIAEATFFLPAVYAASRFPRLLQASNESRDALYLDLRRLNRRLFLGGVMVALLTAFGSVFFVPLVLGPDYEQAVGIVAVLSISVPLIYVRAALSKWILVSGGLHLSLVTHAFGACTNVALNLVFIPEWGALGAAWATVVSYAAASIAALVVDRSGREYIRNAFVN